jgi:two-component system, cell cycle response regulator DivK
VIVAIDTAALRGLPALAECPGESGGRSSRGDDERRHTILVVDDDQSNLKLARFVLEADGFRVEEAVDAVSAFEVLKTCDPSMIVMDIQLPGMDGWELTRRLKTNFATRHIPVIAVTAFGVAGDRQLAAAVGAVDFVEKPISTTELPNIIRRHLRDGS